MNSVFNHWATSILTLSLSPATLFALQRASLNIKITKDHALEAIKQQSNKKKGSQETWAQIINDMPTKGHYFCRIDVVNRLHPDIKQRCRFTCRSFVFNFRKMSITLTSFLLYTSGYSSAYRNRETNVAGYWAGRDNGIWRPSPEAFPLLHGNCYI